MTEPDNVQRPPEFELYKERDDTPPAPGSKPLRWLPVAGLASILAIAIAIAAYFAADRGTTRPAAETSVPDVTPPAADTTAAAARPLGGVPEPVVLPPLNDSDGIVRDLVKRLTSHPSAAALLASDNLIRIFTVSVASIANGRTPAAHLRALRPASRFRVVENGEELSIDPSSYRRYDSLAAAVESVDPAGAAQLYATLKPRLEEAYGELGAADTLDQTLEKTIVHLLQTPTPSAEIALVQPPTGIGYSYADPQIERLSAAQRQFIRMGAINVRRIKASLRRIAFALGIPEAHLPASS